MAGSLRETAPLLGLELALPTPTALTLRHEWLGRNLLSSTTGLLLHLVAGDNHMICRKELSREGRSRVVVSFLKATGFIAVAIVMLMVTGPIVGLLSTMAGIAHVPVWAFAGTYSVLLTVATAVALRLDRSGFGSLGLVATPRRVLEIMVGFVLGVALFAALAVFRGASADAVWSFAGFNGAPTALIGILPAFFLLFPEELLFRGYAFQRLVSAVGAWPGILISAALFGAYHVVGSGMWAMGAFFSFAMPALGGMVFGWAALRTKGLALPVGLHLGGNWVQGSVLSIQPASGPPATLWTARVTDGHLHSLSAPDLHTHLPFIAMLGVAALAVHLMFARQARTV